MELSRKDKLDVARRGLDFAKLQTDPAMKVLLDVLQHEAELAREKLCTATLEEIPPLQHEVWKFRDLMRIINGFVTEGKIMESQLLDEDQLTE